jgi:hypothetical protein
MLLLKRKRIVHKASNKKEIFKEIIQNRFDEKGKLDYTLVYVPEGNEPDYFESDSLDDTTNEDIESAHLIDQYTSIISGVSPYVTVRKFTSQSSDRDSMIEDFSNGKIQVLTSMKCLDEGVDVPRSEMAIFCSSTGNPRQFIQRRGRILRTHPDKQIAIIHDLIVSPKVSHASDSYHLMKSLLKSELIRVREFALLSENPANTILELQDVLNYYGLNLFNNES